MIEWLDTNIAYWHWIVIGLILCVFEIIVPSFFMLWLGLSAVVVGLVLLVVELSFSAQMTLWTILSCLCLVAWFAFISPRMKDKTLSGMGREATLGKQGIVIDHNPESFRGRIKFPAPVLGDDEWPIISEAALKPGDRVTVIDVKGNALEVRKNA